MRLMWRYECRRHWRRKFAKADGASSDLPVFWKTKWRVLLTLPLFPEPSAQSPEMSARRVRKLEEAIERCMAFLRQDADYRVSHPRPVLCPWHGPGYWHRLAGGLKPPN
jgi:hypothetical protein